MKNKINYLISVITTILTALIFIPIKVTGGLKNKNYFGKTTILTFIKNKGTICKNCYNIKILWIQFVIEIIIVFTISLLLLIIIDKRKKQK